MHPPEAESDREVTGIQLPSDGRARYAFSSSRAGSRTRRPGQRSGDRPTETGRREPTAAPTGGNGADPERVAAWSDLPDREHTDVRLEGVDLVVVRDDGVSVPGGRGPHRGVLPGDGANAAVQAVGRLGVWAGESGDCPAGIAAPRDDLEDGTRRTDRRQARRRVPALIHNI
jgi:hypothetical protein